MSVPNPGAPDGGRIELALERIYNQVHDVRERVAASDIRHEQMVDTLTRLDHAINGNGKPGLAKDMMELRMRLERVEQQVRDSEAESDATQHKVGDRRWQVLAMVLSCLSSAVIGIAAGWVRGNHVP